MTLKETIFVGSPILVGRMARMVVHVWLDVLCPGSKQCYRQCLLPSLHHLRLGTKARSPPPSCFPSQSFSMYRTNIDPSHIADLASCAVVPYHHHPISFPIIFSYPIVPHRQSSPPLLRCCAPSPLPSTIVAYHYHIHVATSMVRPSCFPPLSSAPMWIFPVLL